MYVRRQYSRLLYSVDLDIIGVVCVGHPSFLGVEGATQQEDNHIHV